MFSHSFRRLKVRAVRRGVVTRASRARVLSVTASAARPNYFPGSTPLSTLMEPCQVIMGSTRST